jgi:hypothetical protein
MTVPGTPEAIETTRTVEYRLGVSYQLNENPDKYSGLAGSEGSYSDKLAQIEDRFDDLVMREVTTRNGDTVNTDIDVERRWIPKPRRQMVAPLIDRDDIASTKLDLKAPLVVQTARAVRRARANRFLQGFYGNAYTGEVGTTAVPFKAANVLAAGGVGITKNKLISLKELISTRLVDDDEMGLPLFIITAKQVSDLLKINELVSRDYNPLNSDTMKAALLNGVPTDFMGFTFMKSEIGNSKAFPDASTLTVNGSSERLNPVFFKQGIHKGTWTEFFGQITERDDKNFSTQVYGETIAAFTRTNEDLCFQMANVEV